MKLKEIRSNCTQKVIVHHLQNTVDLRLDEALYSKIENGIVLPTTKTITELCKVFEVTPLDIYDFKEIDLVGCGSKAKATEDVTYTRENIYNCSIRLRKEACKFLKRDILRVCGYSSITDYITQCILDIERQYKEALDIAKKRDM